MVQRQDSNLHDLHIGQMKCHPRLPFPSLLHIARLFRAVNQALQILFSPKLHIAGMTITHSPLVLWTFGFTLCSHSFFNCLTHRGCLIFLSRIVPSAANLSCSSVRVVKRLLPSALPHGCRAVYFVISRAHGFVIQQHWCREQDFYLYFSPHISFLVECFC